MKTYLQVMIQNHWTVPLDHLPFFSPSPPKNSLHSAEGFLKSFVQQTA